MDEICDSDVFALHSSRSKSGIRHTAINGLSADELILIPAPVEHIAAQCNGTLQTFDSNQCTDDIISINSRTLKALRHSHAVQLCSSVMRKLSRAGILKVDNKSDKYSDPEEVNKLVNGISACVIRPSSKTSTNRPETSSHYHRSPLCNGNGPAAYSSPLSRDVSRQDTTRTTMPFTYGVDITCNGQRDDQKQRPMFHSTLVKLIEKKSSEVLLTISTPRYGFLTLLDSVGPKNSAIMASILQAIGKAVSSSHSANVECFVNTVQSNKIFMFCSLTGYLASLEELKIDRIHMEAFIKCMDFLECYQKCMPASSSQAISVILPHLKLAAQKMQSEFPFSAVNFPQRVLELETRKKTHINQRTLQDIAKASRVESLFLQKPPENFRELPIFPCHNDIWNPNPFLRPNLVKGQYASVEQYLDIQFRLLREDYIRPLRDSISNYLRMKKNCETARGLKVYENVSIQGYQVVFGGIVHDAHFDAKKFHSVNWDNSKRLLTGSLLCFSGDNFQTFIFGIVAQRMSNNLKRGNLRLKFEQLSDEILQITPAHRFTVLETEAFFEAYRHNLAAFQRLNDENFPLKEYIVETQTEIQPPPYLSDDTIFDYSPLLVPMDTPILEQIAGSPKLFEVLDNDNWPSNEELGLDESQYIALKAALTKQFVIIQGPPGTGKTFIGLRIVQVILKNMPEIEKLSQNPVLVVCYTNHALDQFLEGMLNFTTSIVRVGGRSSNSALLEFQLSQKKRAMRCSRDVPGHIFKSTVVQKRTLHGIESQLKELQRQIDKAKSTVFSECTLIQEMDEIHYTTLLFCNLENAYKSEDHRFMIGYWLDIFEIEYLEVDEESSTDKQGEKITKNTLTEQSNSFLPKDTPAGYISINIHDLFNTSLVKQVEDSTKPEAVPYEQQVDVEYLEAMRVLDEDEWESLDLDLEDCEPSETKKDPTLLTKVEGWSIKGADVEIAAYVRGYLDDESAMSKQEAKRVRNVWSLDYDDRWRLYKYWVNLYIMSLHARLLKLQKVFQNEFQKFKEMQDEEDLNILQDAQIVGMTTTGAAKYRNIVQELNPKIVVVEEAAEILEAHVVTALARDTQHLILIGDHQQLRPNPTVYELAVKYNLGISLFERMINNGMEYHQLCIQHRMRPCIASLLVPHIYPQLLNHESVQGFEDIRGVQKNMFFITHEFAENQEFDSSSRVNHHEAQYLLRLCAYLIHQGYLPSQITILTTYSGQLFVLKELAGRGLFGLRITVVDNFQGEENDIILVSFVRSNDFGSIGFLKTSNRVCVALSRARKGLYCIGNFEQLAQHSKLWKNIVDSLRSSDSIGPNLKLTCQNHADVITEAAMPSDFDNVPEGGCNRSCEYRMNCGHACELLCHPYDLAHDKIKCLKDCVRDLCETGHKCPRKCNEKCPSVCSKIVKKNLPECGHEVSVRCFVDPETFSCPLPCGKLLECSHACRTKCGEPCDSLKCSEPVPILLSCGHELPQPCWKFQESLVLSTDDEVASEDEESVISQESEEFHENCTHPCGTKLHCGHLCSGTCGQCQQGEVHIPCRQRCETILDCGHQCAADCGQDCSTSTCHFLIDLELSCGHGVSVACHKSSSTEELLDTCMQPCKVILMCRHICEGICGTCYKEKYHGRLRWKCPPCKVLVKKTLPCQHSEYVPCHIRACDFTCTQACERKLPCGHRCGLKCGETCSNFLCEEAVSVRMKCGHEMPMSCYKSSVAVSFIGFCESPCGVKLPCGHTCSGTCSNCNQGRLHQACQMQCSRALACGHQCESRCSLPCPPCKKPCEKSCTHGRCSHKCGRPCSICLDPCQWTCDHQKCTNLCGQLCTIEPCNEACSKTLQCSHPCFGLCGDPCLDLCTICEPEKIGQQNFLDSEIKIDAKFVQLNDCRHIFEVMSITKFVSSAQSNNVLSGACCPICNTPIMTTLRFSNQAKIVLSKIDKIKRRVLEKRHAKNTSSLREHIEKVIAKDWENHIFCLTRTVDEEPKLSNDVITKLDTIVGLAEDFIDAFPTFYFQFVFEFYYTLGSDCVLPRSLTQNVTKLRQASRQTYNLICHFIRYYYRDCSQQQILELSHEVQRFKYQCQLLDFFCKRQYKLTYIDESTEELCFKIINVLTDLRQFCPAVEDNLKMDFGKFYQTLGLGRNVSDIVSERRLISKSVTFARDDWC